tara:strand:+ start:98 stop:472 length:375 start_codon:yes stop_codon:yes gene_type:complete
LKRAGVAVLEEIERAGLARVSPPDSVEVSLISDREISLVHAQFMDNPDPTDVITFPYGSEGEILISAETALRQAKELNSQLEQEITLYLVHGILHLVGYEDGTESSRNEMDALQERLLADLSGV